MLKKLPICAVLFLLGSFLSMGAEKKNSALEASILRGVDYLVSHQNKNGSWGGPTHTKDLNIYAPIPDGHRAFHVGSSSLALYGLLETGDKRPGTVKAIEKAEKWLLKELPKVRSIDPNANYNVWGNAYGLHALSALYRRYTDPKRREIYKQQARTQLKLLKRYESVNRGWGYLDFTYHTSHPAPMSTSFVTATVLLAMADAKETMGVKLDDKIVKRAMESLLEQRTADFTYIYAREHRNYPYLAINRPAGALGRAQVCNAAMRTFGDKSVTDKVLRKWIRYFVERNGWLDHGRKRPIPHEAPANVAGYFYYYGHFYASRALRLLPKKDQEKWKGKLAKMIISKQEANGSWWDFPLYNYHCAYGTGFALATLSQYR